ncbi:hypothetical protein AB0K48_22265 [Nonomuraea sp. NPDC055795]
MKLQPYSEYARQARSCLSDARDWLNSDWPDGQGPTSGQAQGRRDAMVLMAYAKEAIEGRWLLTDEARDALARSAER